MPEELCQVLAPAQSTQVISGNLASVVIISSQNRSNQKKCLPLFPKEIKQNKSMQGFCFLLHKQRLRCKTFTSLFSLSNLVFLFSNYFQHKCRHKEYSKKGKGLPLKIDHGQIRKNFQTATLIQLWNRLKRNSW